MRRSVIRPQGKQPGPAEAEAEEEDQEQGQRTDGGLTSFLLACCAPIVALCTAMNALFRTPTAHTPAEHPVPHGSLADSLNGAAAGDGGASGGGGAKGAAHVDPQHQGSLIAATQETQTEAQAYIQEIHRKIQQITERYNKAITSIQQTLLPLKDKEQRAQRSITQIRSTLDTSKSSMKEAITNEIKALHGVKADVEAQVTAITAQITRAELEKTQAQREQESALTAIREHGTASEMWTKESSSSHKDYTDVETKTRKAVNQLVQFQYSEAEGLIGQFEQCFKQRQAERGPKIEETARNITDTSTLQLRPRLEQQNSSLQGENNPLARIIKSSKQANYAIEEDVCSTVALTADTEPLRILRNDSLEAIKPDIDKLIKKDRELYDIKLATQEYKDNLTQLQYQIKTIKGNSKYLCDSIEELQRIDTKSIAELDKITARADGLYSERGDNQVMKKIASKALTAAEQAQAEAAAAKQLAAAAKKHAAAETQRANSAQAEAAKQKKLNNKMPAAAVTDYDVVRGGGQFEKPIPSTPPTQQDAAYIGGGAGAGNITPGAGAPPAQQHATYSGVVGGTGQFRQPTPSAPPPEKFDPATGKQLKPGGSAATPGGPQPPKKTW